MKSPEGCLEYRPDTLWFLGSFNDQVGVTKSCKTDENVLIKIMKMLITWMIRERKMK